MIKRSLVLLTAALALPCVIAGCAQAPAITHPTENLERVDCLACHQLGLKGATIIPHSHLDAEGMVRHEDCACHKPAPAEEQTPWGEASLAGGMAEALGIVAAVAVPSAAALAMARVDRRLNPDT